MILKGLLHALSRKSEEFLVFLHLPLKKKKTKKTSSLPGDIWQCVCDSLPCEKLQDYDLQN